MTLPRDLDPETESVLNILADELVAAVKECGLLLAADDQNVLKTIQELSETNRPAQLKAIDANFAQRTQSLVGGIEVDLDAPLPKDGEER